MQCGDTVRAIDTNNPLWCEGQLATLVTSSGDGWMAEFNVNGYSGCWWITNAHIEKVNYIGGIDGR